MSSSLWGLAEQIISMEGIIETIAVIGDISYEVPEIQLFNDIPNTPEINLRVHDILWEAVGELDRLRDSLMSQDGGQKIKFHFM